MKLFIPMRHKTNYHDEKIKSMVNAYNWCDFNRKWNSFTWNQNFHQEKIAFDKPVQVFIVSELELRYIPHPKLLVRISKLWCNR
jgi:hypothetical protein